MQTKPDSALIIVGHGSTENPDSSAPTMLHAREIRRRNLFREVAVCFWKEEPSMREVGRMIDSGDIYVVPNFISEGYFTRTIIPREMGLTGEITQNEGRTWKYCEPVGNHERMTELLLKRAEEVAPCVPLEETALLIVGHGTGLNDNSAVAAKTQVARIRELTTYAEVLSTYMEEPPLIADWHMITNAPNVVVVPFFISDGLHSYQDIPVLLGIDAAPAEAASRSGMFRQNPHYLRGRTLFYASSIGTEPLFADVILDQVSAFDATHPATFSVFS